MHRISGDSVTSLAACKHQKNIQFQCINASLASVHMLFLSSCLQADAQFYTDLPSVVLITHSQYHKNKLQMLQDSVIKVLNTKQITSRMSEKCFEGEFYAYAKSSFSFKTPETTRSQDEMHVTFRLCERETYNVIHRFTSATQYLTYMVFYMYPV